MKIEYFECFQMLVKHRNFSEAAEGLYMSQSSLSKKIIEMENQLGGELFIRKKYEVVLSPFGEQMAGYINNIMEDYNILCRAAENYKLNRQKNLRVAALLNAAQSGIMDFITQFEGDKEDFYIETIEKSHNKLKQMLISHQVDVCYAYEELMGDIPDYKKILIREEPLVLISNRQYAQVKGWKKKISLAEARHESFCFPREDRALFLYFLSNCKRNGFTPELTLSDVRLETIKKYIYRNMRCTLQMEKLAKSVFDEEHFSILYLEEFPVLNLSMYVDCTHASSIKESFVRKSIAYYTD